MLIMDITVTYINEAVEDLDGDLFLVVRFPHMHPVSINRFGWSLPTSAL